MTRTALRLLIGALLALCLAAPVFAASPPAINGVVTDYTGKLSTDDQATIKTTIDTVVGNSNGRIHGIYVLFATDMQGNTLETSDRWGNSIFTSNSLGGTDILITVAFGPNGVIITSGGNLDGYFSVRGADGSKTQRTYIGNTIKADLKAKNYRNAMVTAVNLIGQIVPAASSSQSSGQVPVAPAAPVQQSAPVASVPAQQRSGPGAGFWCFLLFIIAVVALLVWLWWRRQNGYTDLSTDTPTYGGTPGYSGRRRRRDTYRPGGWRDGSYVDNSTVIVTGGTTHHHHDRDDRPASGWSTPAPSSDTTSFGGDDDNGRSSTTSFTIDAPSSDPAPSSDSTGF